MRKKYTREYGKKKEVDDDDTEIKYVEKWKKRISKKALTQLRVHDMISKSAI